MITIKGRHYGALAFALLCPAPDNSNARRLLWAFIVTAGFMLIEAVGGAISGSLALLADAGHMLTDSAALLFALLAVRFASRPPNARHTFGWLRLTTRRRFSMLLLWW
nr:Zinc transporter zitB [Klebsiella pneumoniae]